MRQDEAGKYICLPSGFGRATSHNSRLPWGGADVCGVYCLPPGRFRPFVILLTFPSPSCYSSSLDRFVHVDLGVIQGMYNIGEGTEVSRTIFPPQGSRQHILLSWLHPPQQAFCRASHPPNLHGAQLHLPFGKSISPSSGKSLGLKMHYHSPRSTPNSIFIQVWVIKFMATAWAGWVRVDSKEIIAFTKSPNRASVRAGSLCILSLSRLNPAVPGQENSRNPPGSQARSCHSPPPGALCMHIPWTNLSHMSLNCNDY